MRERNNMKQMGLSWIDPGKLPGSGFGTHASGHLCFVMGLSGVRGQSECGITHGFYQLYSRKYVVFSVVFLLVKLVLIDRSKINMSGVSFSYFAQC